jgi:hypothetical protein
MALSPFSMKRCRLRSTQLNVDTVKERCRSISSLPTMRALQGGNAKFRMIGADVDLSIWRLRDSVTERLARSKTYSTTSTPTFVQGWQRTRLRTDEEVVQN